MKQEEMKNITEDEWAKIILDTKNYSKEARCQAAFHLEKFEKETSLDAMIKALQTDPSPIVRHEIAFSLGETAKLSQKVRDALRRSIQTDENIFVRHEAMLALATLGNKEDVPFMQSYLDDKNQEIRESAEIAIQRLQEEFKTLQK